VHHCGIQTEGAGLAAWTEDTDNGTFVVVLTGGSGGVKGFEGALKEGGTYPDGVYMVVYTAAKEDR
jgi:hypothetical protein